jgi:hypothetical protein
VNLRLNEMIERERRRDELAEIRIAQMLAREQRSASGKVAGYPWMHRLLAGLGAALVAAGTGLQLRYAQLAEQPTALLSAEVQSPCPEQGC